MPCAGLDERLAHAPLSGRMLKRLRKGIRIRGSPTFRGSATAFQVRALVETAFLRDLGFDCTEIDRLLQRMKRRYRLIEHLLNQEAGPGAS